jgi:hypothetical protein
MSSGLPLKADVARCSRHVSKVPIVLQKSFCGMGLKFSEARARRLNNDVGDHVATRQTHRRFWQRVCSSIERRLSLVSFFGENLAAVAFGTFATWGNSGIEPDKGKGISSPGTYEASLMGPRNDGERQWNTMSDWTCR